MAFWVRYSRRLLEAVGATEIGDSHAEAITRRFSDYTPRAELNHGAFETLSGLKRAGYRLGLVSNRSHPLDSVVEELGLTGMFEFVLAAGEVGIWKPDPGILLEALRLGQCSPECSVYVGDNYYADVVSARAAGLTPVLLDPEGLFPEVKCRVISCLTELLDWLAK